jgi:HSP20 family molecular chaperone IbpA
MTFSSLLPRTGHRAELRRLYHLAWDPSSHASGLAARVDALADELRYYLEDSLEECSKDSTEVPDRVFSYVVEDEEMVQICVDLTGIDPSEIDVSLLSPGAPMQLICLRVVHQIEGTQGSFTHTITLPHAVRGNRARASLQDGTLRIQCPRRNRQEKRVRKIPILPAP